MNYLNKIGEILKRFRHTFYPLVILGLLIVMQFKNGTIKHLREDVNSKPKIEIIHAPIVTEYIKGDSIPYPVKVEKTKWRTKEVPVYVEQPINLTTEDSASITEAYTRLYDSYAEIKTYEKVFKDDTIAYIKVTEKMQYNTLLSNNVEFIRKYPTTRITTIKQDKTLSFVGGLDASIGKEFNSISIGAGFVTPSNRVYLFRYDPINKGWGGAIYMPIFNIRK